MKLAPLVSHFTDRETEAFLCSPFLAFITLCGPLCVYLVICFIPGSHIISWTPRGQGFPFRGVGGLARAVSGTQEVLSKDLFDGWIRCRRLSLVHSLPTHQRWSWDLNLWSSASQLGESLYPNRPSAPSGRAKVFPESAARLWSGTHLGSDTGSTTQLGDTWKATCPFWTQGSTYLK